MAKLSKLMIVLFVLIAGIVPLVGYTYILPSSQIIEFMVEKFSAVTAVSIIQVAKIRDFEQETETVFGESLYATSGNLYRSEVVGQPGKRLIVHNGSRTLKVVDGEITDEREDNAFLYRFILLANDPEQLLVRLQQVGINIDTVSLTRIEGRVAYLIGDREEWNPQLLVDKELFLPLLLKYDNFLFRFSDYREFMAQAWYPYQIMALAQEGIIEEYTLKDITANPPIDETLFDIPMIISQFGASEVKPDEQELKIQGTVPSEP